MSYWTQLRLPTERELVVGLYDLRGYTIYCEKTEPMRALDVMARYAELAAAILQDAGGWFVKPIGDAGLFAFPAEQADDAVSAVLALQNRGDPWLTAQGYKGWVRTHMHVGMVAIGRIGAKGREQLDIIGKTVNIVGAMRSEGTIAMTPALFRRLSPPLRKLFKKHTPPVSYIAADDPRPRRG